MILGNLGIEEDYLACSQFNVSKIRTLFYCTHVLVADKLLKKTQSLVVVCLWFSTGTGNGIAKAMYECYDITTAALYFIKGKTSCLISLIFHTTEKYEYIVVFMKYSYPISYLNTILNLQ